jgi:beta-lactamase class A
MSKNQKIALVGFVLVVFGAGTFAGKVIFKKNRPQPSSASTAALAGANGTYGYVNPFLDLISAAGINMLELKTFRPQVEACINKFIRKHPDLHVAYYFRDLNNGMWLGINEQEEFSPASLMKVPLMVAVLKESQTNPDLLKTKILYRQSQYSTIDEESGFRKQDSTFYTVEELINHSIQYSDNAATLMLMDLIGMQKVESTEGDLNLAVDAKESFYSNFVKVKAYCGAFRILYNASYLPRPLSDKALQILAGSKFEGGIRKSIPPSIRIAHKYGERDVFEADGRRNTLQLHHFGIVYYPSKPFLLGIMTRGSSKEVKEELIEELAAITYGEVDKQMKEKRKSPINIDY